MKRKLLYTFLLLLVFCLFSGALLKEVFQVSRQSRLNAKTVTSDPFRRQPVNQQMESYIKDQDTPGRKLAVYWLETGFGRESFPGGYTDRNFSVLEEKWKKQKDWKRYMAACAAIWDDVCYFPIPEGNDRADAEVSYVDSWMFERTYGGKRGHEGTDIMPSRNKRGYYPVVSMTDGIVLSKGWLEKGGYRIGILAPAGAYFYYAHLDSYAELEEGDSVKAGDLLGFMGDTGYSKIEGTTGKFPVHLHLGIYLILDGQEISVNPYPVLRYLDGRKIKCRYSR